MIVATLQKQQQQNKHAVAATATAGATNTSAEEETLKRNTDCVYFLASPLTCKKGSECEYRHSEYARINPRDCYYWLNGNCMNQNCGFRHPPLDGFLGTQVAAPAASSMPSSHISVTPTPTAYNQGVSYNPRKQAVPCVFFQKGLCLKGDWCAFLHGPSTSNKSPQPPAANITATEPNSYQKTFGAAESSQLHKFLPTNVSKTVGVHPEGKPAPKVGAASTRNDTTVGRSVPHPSGMDEELPQRKGTYTTSVVNGSAMGRSNRLHQLHVSDEPSCHDGKETDEFLRESSPGFDVIVDDEHGDSDFYHSEERYGGARGHAGRNVNEYDIGHATNYDAIVDVDRDMFLDGPGYDSLDHVQGNYGWNQRRASSERISLGPSTLERRGYTRVHSPDRVEESDLRHRLSKHRRVNGLRSVFNQDHALENHEREENYCDSLRDTHHFSSRLRGRIKLPGRSLGNGTDSCSERRIERERNCGRLSPGKPHTTSRQGRLRDRIKVRVEGEYNNKDGRRFGGSRIGREIMDEMNADFAGPKRLAELKVCKNTDNELLSLGKRKSIEGRQQTEGDISFDGPKSLREILKRKRQSEPTASGSGIASVHKDVNQKQSKESLNGSSTNTVVSLTLEEANRKDQSKSTSADIGTAEAAHGKSPQLNIHKLENEDGTIGDVTTENHNHDADDQGDEGEYNYEEGDEGEYNYEGENADPEEEYIEEEDGEDFEKKLGVMYL
ncbi:zinc finger CCCH domain-containing protein 17-like isoform X1 [Hibiscus syriacus]|uniref:zinc finger CCCH domain-containing protein 17-like isoform X1 n=1 Tax=Hibiscus syriacus TaxID=106335 RepID=UPI001922DB31|nr:zinc finger CCCH domain-containing protein 17-like isoform X1 [Hibiscus syriacus]